MGTWNDLTYDEKTAAIAEQNRRNLAARTFAADMEAARVSARLNETEVQRDWRESCGEGC